MSRPGDSRFLRRNIGPVILFVCGAAVIPAFLFQRSVVVKLVQVIVFAVLATAAGKKIKPVYFLVMVTSITFFNVLSPLGRVLIQIGPFPVTETALVSGVVKGLTIVGLVFISLFSIRPDLRLPGRMGGMIGRVFFYFERIIEGKRRKLEPRRLIASIDEILEEIFEPGVPEAEAKATIIKTTRLGYLIAFAIPVVNWVLLLPFFATIGAV